MKQLLDFIGCIRSRFRVWHRKSLAGPFVWVISGWYPANLQQREATSFSLGCHQRGPQFNHGSVPPVEAKREQTLGLSQVRAVLPHTNESRLNYTGCPLGATPNTRQSLCFARFTRRGSSNDHLSFRNCFERLYTPFTCISANSIPGHSENALTDGRVGVSWGDCNDYISTLQLISPTARVRSQTRLRRTKARSADLQRP